MTSWIWVNLLRLSGEEFLGFFTMFGVVSFAGMALLGRSSSMFSLPGLGDFAFIGGLVALLGFVILGAFGFVGFTIAADLISAGLESADSLRSLAQGGRLPGPTLQAGPRGIPQAMACPTCGALLPPGARFCGDCGSVLAG